MAAEELQIGAGPPRVGGRYIILLELAEAVQLEVRSGTVFGLRPGTYAYVGSAMGPGGLAARIGRYRRPDLRRHWHVDFLLAHARLLEAFCFGPAVAECFLAESVAALPGSVPVTGFGCSDCRCRAHLFRLSAFRRAPGLVDDLAQLVPDLNRHLLGRVDLRRKRS